MMLSERINADLKKIDDLAKEIIENGNISDMWQAEAHLKTTITVLSISTRYIHIRSIEEALDEKEKKEKLNQEPKNENMQNMRNTITEQQAEILL